MTGRVLVTGSAGFLGRHLCRMLSEREDEVVGFDVREGSSAARKIEGSVSDPSVWERVGPVDAVIHGAAITDLWRRDSADFDEVNRRGTELAAVFAARAQAPLIYISSYTTLMSKTSAPGEVLRGNEAPAPRNLIGAYARSKREAEMGARTAHPRTIVVHPTAPIGPGDFQLTPPMRLLRDVAAGSLPGVMRGRINVVDIRDVAAGVLAALDRGESGAHYLLAGEDLTLRAFADRGAAAADVKPPGMTVPPFVASLAARAETAIAGVTGRPPRAPVDGVRLAALDVSFDAGRAKAELGFCPRPTGDAIRDALDFLRQEGLLAG